MIHPSIPSQEKRSTLAHSRRQLIYYMGNVANDSSSSLASLKKIAASKEFKGLLTLLSGVGTPRMIKLLQSASRNCAAKKAETAERNNAKKRADAVSDRPGSTKRARLHDSERSSDHAKGTAYNDSGGSEPLSSCSEESNIQRLLGEGQIPSGLHNSNQSRRQTLGLSSSSLMWKPKDEHGTMLDSGLDTASLRHSDPSRHGDNDSRSSVKAEYEGSASKFLEKSGNFTQNPGQDEDERIRTGKELQSAHGNGGNTTYIGTAYPSEASITKEKALQLEAWDMYKREVGIIRRDPTVIAPIENHCRKTLVDASNRRSGNPKREIGELLSDIEQLDFLFAKDRLVTYLNNRQARLGMQTETPATWTMSEPQQVLGALRTIGMICDDAHIHRAFAQMKLCLLVQQRLESGYKPISSGKGKPRHAETNYLEELARSEAGPVSEDEVEAKIRYYLSQHKAGKRWLQVADWFGGPGIVLVFITAGIGPFHVAAGWKVFQRRCLKYISQSLYSIRGLVGALGTDCLESYCQYGHLPRNYINKVIDYEGIIPAEEIDEDGSEMDETEEDASGAEIHDAKDEENGIDTSDSDMESGNDETASQYDEEASE